MDPVSIALTTLGWLIQPLMDKAVTALLEQWAKRVGLGEGLVALKEELTLIDSTLETALRYQTENKALLKLLKGLQQLAYQADDLLDDLDYYRIKHDVLDGGNSSSQIADSTGSSSSSSFGSKLMSNAIHSVSNFPFTITMSERMNKLVEELQKTDETVRKALVLDAAVPYSRVNLDNQATVTNRRVTTSYPPQKVYGRDQERDNLIKLLVGDEVASQTLSVIAIVGHGGVGKTTLAQLVCNDQRIQNYFKLKMWVTVSVNFDIERLTKEILESAPNSNCMGITNLDRLQRKLEEMLKGKIFLLVLDDLWEDKDASQWEMLLAPLRNGSTEGNVVLVTTRNPAVAEMVQTTKPNIILDGLKNDDYWSLFEACTFGNEMHVPQNLENIGREIVRKLKGNPLAAKTVGALLKKNPNANYWMRVLEMEKWKHQTGAHDIMPALRISYDCLEVHLQHCFSYCALFPKDYEFEKQELVNIWSAQSLLYDQDKRMKEVGEDYLKDLVDFGFFEKKYYFENLFGIHDLLHDLAQMVSLEECLSVDGGEIQAILPTTRHLSILHGSDKIEKELTKVEKDVKPQKLSTLMFFGLEHSLDPEALKRFQSKFKDANGLRVLRLGTIPDAELLLSSLCNFTHLRYLQLYSNYACNTLPSIICQLYHLQVLDVCQWKNLKELPNNFNNLINLRYFIPHYENLFSLIAGVRKLTNLQKLPVFRVRKEREFAIKQLRGLKELGGELRIYNMENVESTEEAKGAGLIEKSFLNGLQLSWGFRENSDVEHNADALVLEHLQPHRNLKKLTITGYCGATSPTWLTRQSMLTYLLEYVILDNCMAWEILPPFGQLPFLKRLVLKHMTNAREIEPNLSCYGQHMPFQCLKELILTDMPKLAKWIWNYLPALSKLSIGKCPKLDFQLSKLEADLNEQFPELDFQGLQLTSLTELILKSCDTTGKQLLQHVPALKRLAFHNCRKLASLNGLHSLACLERLEVMDCPSFVDAWISTSDSGFSMPLKDLSIDNTALLAMPICKQLTSLKCLTFIRVADLTKEQEESLLLLTSLTMIMFYPSPDLRHLPANLHQLPSVKILYIIGCENIQSKPENGLPKSLKELNVNGCGDEVRKMFEEYPELMPKL